MFSFPNRGKTGTGPVRFAGMPIPTPSFSQTLPSPTIRGMSTNTWIGVIVAAAVVIGVFYYFNSRQGMTTDFGMDMPQQESATSTGATAPTGASAQPSG